MFELVVMADENDGDYQTAISEINQENLNKFMELLSRVMSRMESRKAENPNRWEWRHNWENNERGDPAKQYPDWTTEEIEFFSEYLPYSEYGLHTIVKVEYYPKPEKITLLSL